MSNFSEKMRQTWDQNILFSALLELTYNCNLDCSFCYNEKNIQGQTLDKAQYSKLLKELREIGVFNLILSGGEPLAHKDFFYIGRKAKALGFVVRIKSNGHALHRATVERLKKEVDPFIIEISLHGACAPTHDKQTRIPGSFEQLMKNLQILKTLDCRFQLNSVLTRWNEAEIEAMYRLAEDFAVPLKFDSQVTPRDDGDTSPLEISPSTEGLRQLFEIQHQYALQMQSDDDTGDSAATRNYCGAGSSTIAIDPVGNVFPCVQWRTSIGNIHKANMTEIWKSNPRLTAIRSANHQARKNILEQGKKASYGAFCPGVADLMSGNPTTIYPSVHLRSKLRTDILNAKD